MSIVVILEFATELNWLATAVAALVYFILGGFWFSSKAFGPVWDRAIGFTRPEDWKPGTLYYLGPLATCVIVALAVSLLVQALAVDTIGGAVALGVVIGVGIGTAVSIVNAITPNNVHPVLYGVVTGTYHACGITIVAIVLALWQ